MISPNDFFDLEQDRSDCCQPYHYSNDDEINILENLNEEDDDFGELNFDNNEVRS
jgi:hypothetical protein